MQLSLILPFSRHLYTPNLYVSSTIKPNMVPQETEKHPPLQGKPVP